MNIEFAILIIDYFKTLKRRDFIFEWSLPFLLCLLIFYLNYNNKDIKNDAINQSSSLISLLGILIGFSIAVITLLITSNTKNIEEIKSKLTRYSNVNKKVTLFDLLIITYTYTVISEIILLIFNLFVPSIMKEICSLHKVSILNTLNLFGVMHVLFVTIRNVTNFYFILIKK